MTRIDVATPLHEEVGKRCAASQSNAAQLQLITLIPKTNIKNTNMPVQTAYNNQTRVFYVSVASSPSASEHQASIFALQINAAVTNVTKTATLSVTFPKGTAKIVRLHAAPGNRLFGIFDTGSVYEIDTATGEVYFFAHI